MCGVGGELVGAEYFVIQRGEIDEDSAPLPGCSHVEMIGVVPEIAMNVAVDVRQGWPSVKQGGQRTAPYVFTAKGAIQEPVGRCVGN